MARIPEGIVLIADEENVKPTIVELEAAMAAGLYNPDTAPTKSDDVMILDPVSKKWTPRRPSVHVPFMPRKTDWDLARSRKLAKAKAAAAKKATRAEAASPKPTRHVSTRHRVTTPAEAESSALGAGHELAQVTSATLVAPVLTTTTQVLRPEPSALPITTDIEMSDEPTQLALSPPASQQSFSTSTTPTDLHTQMQHLQLSNQAKDQELARTRAFLYWQMQIQQQTQSQSQLEQQLLRAQIHDLQQRQRLATAGPAWTPFFQQQPAHQRIETRQSPIKIDPADWSAIYKAARLQER